MAARLVATGRWLIPVVALSLAQAVRAEDDAQLWIALQASGPISGPVELAADVIERRGDNADGLYQRVWNAQLGYRLNKATLIQAGYVDARNYTGGRRTVLERRLRQTLTTTLARPWGGALQLRLRSEQRWRDGPASGTGWRARALVRYNHPLGRKLTGYVWHESFVNLNDTSWGQRSGWERMRNAVGVQVPLTRHIRADLGYLNQYLKRPGEDEDAHVANLALSVSW